MRKNLRGAAFALALAFPLLAQPPVPSGLKLKDLRAAAPCILADRESRTYYLYTPASPSLTGQNRAGVLAYKSKNLETWEGPRVAFVIPDGLWASPAQGLWAPKVHVYRGKYYLFATLTNDDAVISKPPETWRSVTRRGTQIFVGDTPEGPFRPLANRPAPPEDFVTEDGTLYVEGDIPYMVYAHSWVQIIDGAVEAVRLKTDLSETVGEPFQLFKASDAPWLSEPSSATKSPRHYAAGSPLLYRTRDGKLLLIWSSRKGNEYVQTLAWSLSGRLRGPWRQLQPLLTNDTGYGMIFQAFDGRLMLVAVHPATSQLPGAVLLELEDLGDSIRIKK